MKTFKAKSVLLFFTFIFLLLTFYSCTKEIFREVAVNTIDITTITAKAANYFKGYILPNPTQDHYTNNYWQFVPKIKIQSAELKWHPLLSNYLFAFMLSSILRYQPHLFTDGSKDSFIAEAWCNQSATTSIRYFLTEMPKQNIRIN